MLTLVTASSLVCAIQGAFLYGNWLNLTSKNQMPEASSIVCDAGTDCFIFCQCRDACGPNGNINCPNGYNCNIIIDNHGQYCPNTGSAMRIVQINAKNSLSLNIQVYQNDNDMNDVYINVPQNGITNITCGITTYNTDSSITACGDSISIRSPNGWDNVFMTYYEYSNSIDIGSTGHNMQCGLDREFRCDGFAYNSDNLVVCANDEPFCNDFTDYPTMTPSMAPTLAPSASPSNTPSMPTVNPTQEPTTEPTSEPTTEPTIEPTINPTSIDQEVIEETNDESDDDSEDKDDPINWIWRIALILFGCWLIFVGVYCFKKKRKLPSTNTSADDGEKQNSIAPENVNVLETEMRMQIQSGHRDSDIIIRKPLKEGERVGKATPGEQEDLFESSDSDDHKEITAGGDIETKKKIFITGHVQDTNKGDGIENVPKPKRKLKGKKDDGVVGHVMDTPQNVQIKNKMDVIGNVVDTPQNKL